MTTKEQEDKAIKELFDCIEKYGLISTKHFLELIFEDRKLCWYCGDNEPCHCLKDE